MIDRLYTLTDICVEENIDSDFKCGICMDIFRSPIQCSGGHSWCLDCIIQNVKTTCPICPRLIDSTVNCIVNYSLKSIIGKMHFKCPHSSLPKNDMEIDNCEPVDL